MKKWIGLALLLLGIASLVLAGIQVPGLLEGIDRVEQSEQEVREQKQIMEEAAAKAATIPPGSEDWSRAQHDAEYEIHRMEGSLTLLKGRKKRLGDRKMYLMVFTPLGVVLLAGGGLLFRSTRRQVG